jgi:hypothetical protein
MIGYIYIYIYISLSLLWGVEERKRAMRLFVGERMDEGERMERPIRIFGVLGGEDKRRDENRNDMEMRSRTRTGEADSRDQGKNGRGPKIDIYSYVYCISVRSRG